MSRPDDIHTGTPLQVAARVTNPFAPADLSEFTSEQLSVAAGTLRRHKVSLMGLRHIHGNAALDTPLGEHIERDRDRYRSERGEYERIRLLLREDGVDSMLFKSTGLFPSFHYLSSNLDVIIPDGRFADVRRRLVELGYVELLNVEEPRKRLFRRFPGDGSTFAFHLHEVVGWGVPFLDNAPLWAGARRPEDDPDILIPAPREALLITAAHWFYEDKELTLGNMLLTANALHEFAGPLAEAAELAAARGWEEGFWGACKVLDRSWRSLYGHGFLTPVRRAEVDRAIERFNVMRSIVLAHVHYGDRTPAVVPFLRNKVVYYRKIARDPSRSVWRRTRDAVETLLWAVRWKLHVRSQRPILVSVSGCDGSGKSLQVERLATTFDTCDIRNRVIWARGASSRFMSLFIRLGKALMGRPGGSDSGAGSGNEAARFEQRRRFLGDSAARRDVFACLYALDLVWPYVIKPRLLMWVGFVVIGDRYVYDALVDYTLFSGDRIDQLPRPLRWLERAAVRPRVRVLLDVEPQEALRRKPEEGETVHLEEARAAFAVLAERHDLELVPGEQAIDAISCRLAKTSLDAFYDRYGTILNALLWSNPSQLNTRPGVR